jgi:hypothetical protein
VACVDDVNITALKTIDLQFDLDMIYLLFQCKIHYVCADSKTESNLSYSTVIFLSEQLEIRFQNTLSDVRFIGSAIIHRHH